MARLVVQIGIVILFVWLVLVLLHYPYDTDRPLTTPEVHANIAYYSRAYLAPVEESQSERDLKYEQVARQAAEEVDVEGRLRRFVNQYGLQSKKVLDVGSGRGYLQDIVQDYAGLDISPSVQSRYHKKFVLGSATAMPFQNNEFDAIWSIWVLEHVPNPEQALREMRRVVRDGGLLYLMPAFDCASWLADGYPVRPYSDLNWKGKMIKASLSVRSNSYFTRSYSIPIRLIRGLTVRLSGGPSTFRYRRLTPNYEHYWMPDSDAVNSFSMPELPMWFLSRGDECIDCSFYWGFVDTPPDAIIIRIKKSST